MIVNTLKVYIYIYNSTDININSMNIHTCGYTYVYTYGILLAQDAFMPDRATSIEALLPRSGHAILDREAVEMIERAEPFPVMPGEMSGEVLELRVPVAYKIDEDSRTRDIPPIYLD